MNKLSQYVYSHRNDELIGSAMDYIAGKAKELEQELEAKDKLLAKSIPKENVMNLARIIRADQTEANENENFGEAEVLGEVFDQIVKLLKENQ